MLNTSIRQEQQQENDEEQLVIEDDFAKHGGDQEDARLVRE